MIRVEGLTKAYGDRMAVNGLSFAVGPGEVLGLVGPNGAGKTTTLRCLAGIVIPTAGSVYIGEHSLRDEPVLAKGRLAFIPDEPQLFEYLTIDEHLQFMARLYQVPDAESRARELLRELDLEDRRRAFPSELSRGMKQKLAIACGLLHAPDVLMFDEPLTGLDPIGIRRMKRTIRQRAASGAAVILSSHLLTLVEELCTRLLLLRRGECVAAGTIVEIVGARPDLQGQSLEEVFIALVGENT